MQDEQIQVNPKDMTPEQAHAEALRRIEAAVESGQDWLDLGDLPIEVIPQDIAKLSGTLKHLALGCNAFDPERGEFEFDSDRTKTPVRLRDLVRLEGLCALQSLDLSNCKQLTGLLPLSKLSTMQSLHLSCCEQIADLSPLAGLIALRILDLRFCARISDLTPLSELTALQGLYLNNCVQIVDFSPIAGITSLRWLHLDECRQITDLSFFFAGLTELNSLDLNSCKQITDLSPLAKLSALQSLDLSYCTQIIDFSPLVGLTALRSLDLNGCTQITDLLPLAELSALQTLYLFGCEQITNISPLAGFSALQELHLSNCVQIADLTPLAKLHQLESLSLEGLHASASLRPDQLFAHHPSLQYLAVDQLHVTPPEVLSKNFGENCLPRLHSWWHDLQQGEAESHEIKLFILGNGRVGKTQLFRRLRGEAFDPDQPSTHGIQLGRFELCTHDDGRRVFLNVWDFGGQDIYLGTHALFLQSRAIFILAWHPEHESDAPYTEALSGLPMRHRPLRYWLDYIHSLAGSDAPLVVVQTRCEREHDACDPALVDSERFGWLKTAVSCASHDDGVDELRGPLKRAARYRMEQQAPPRLPASWLRVRDRLAAMRATRKSIDLQTFNDVCADTQGSAVPAALLHYLHQAGDVFHREGLFRDAIVLDQQWALDAIYSLFQREGLLPLLHRQGGMFAPALLGFAGWDGRYTAAEQALLRSMMESCHLIFPVHRWNDGDALYAMPDALPLRAEISGQLDAVWPEAANDIQATMHYRFLHDGILRQFLGHIGRLAGPHALYWRYGVCFHDANTRSRARIDTTLDADGPGKVTIETRGPGAGKLRQRILEMFENIRIGEAPQIECDDSAPAALPHPTPEDTETRPIAPAPIPLSPEQKPVVYLSYAWGGKDRPELKAFAVDLHRSLEADFDVRRDEQATRSGDRISEFMREIGRGARVLVLLSDKYARSANCMQELLYLYQQHLMDAKELQRHVLPLIVDKEFHCSTEQRIGYVKHWKSELARLKLLIEGLEPYECMSAIAEIQAINGFVGMTDSMLQFAGDVLMPRGMECLKEGDFSEVKASLSRLRGH
jgi:internalin A